MSRFEVSSVDGDRKNGGIDNPAMQTDRDDPVELNVYGLYSKRNSITHPTVYGEAKRKSSFGFTQLTR